MDVDSCMDGASGKGAHGEVIRGFEIERDVAEPRVHREETIPWDTLTLRDDGLAGGVADVGGVAPAVAADPEDDGERTRGKAGDG